MFALLAESVTVPCLKLVETFELATSVSSTLQTQTHPLCRFLLGLSFLRHIPSTEQAVSSLDRSFP